MLNIASIAVVTETPCLQPALQSQATGDTVNIPYQLKAVRNAVVKFKQLVPSSAYNQMFGNGRDFSVSCQYPPRMTQQSALEYLASVSADSISGIRDHLGSLSAVEQSIYNTLVESKWQYRHQTNGNVTEANTLNLLSYRALQRDQIAARTNTFSDDIEGTSNTDFVFFAVQIEDAENPTTVRDTLHCKIDYGATAYLINEYHPAAASGYLTLTDHNTCQVPTLTALHHKPFLLEYRTAAKEARRELYEPRTDRVPIFSSADAKVGVALYLIDFLRNSKDHKFKDYVASNIAKPAALDEILQMVFQLEFHIPRIVSTRDFLKVTLRPAQIHELVSASSLTLLDAFLSDPALVEKILYEALYTHNNLILAYLHHNIRAKPRYPEVTYTPFTCSMLDDRAITQR